MSQERAPEALGTGSVLEVGLDETWSKMFGGDATSSQARRHRVGPRRTSLVAVDEGVASGSRLGNAGVDWRRRGLRGVAQAT